MATKTKSISPKRAPKLPDKLSDCLAVALSDLIKCERMKSKYKIEMGSWHAPESFWADSTRCEVCLAGSVMACSLNASRGDYVDPEDYPHAVRNRLHAINALREGDIETAMECIGGTLPFGLAESVDVDDYENNHKQFKADMRQLVQLLRKHGL